MFRSYGAPVGFLVLIFFPFVVASEQTLGTPPAAYAVPAGPRIDGPPPPAAPAVVNRDVQGRATIRATRIAAPLTLDGRLDEEIYSRVPAAGDFVQQLPRDNVPATEATRLWLFFDDKNLYVAVRCDDSEPQLETATEMRRDANNVFNNENITITLDTFYDHRNGFFFETSPLGTIRDQSIVDSQADSSWNTVWDVRSSRDAGGWSTEMVIPFKSLRYNGSGAQVWGINVRREIHWKNEYDFLSAVPRSYGPGAIAQMNVAGTLVGVETPAQSINLEVKPYVVSTLASDRAAPVPYANDFSKNAGFDFKYGLTRGLVLDATVNTDFAQVEEDAQQVNLTRFSLFFPEKRDFFLEGQGLFAFGGAPYGTQGNDATSAEVPILFFSRQIGLVNGQTVPVRAGARLTGRAGAFSIGALNIETGASDATGLGATNFSVLRMKRNILRRSNIGFIATRRAPSVAAGTGSSNYEGGLDTNLAFYQNVAFVGYYARAGAAGSRHGNASYRGRFDYTGDAFGMQLEHIAIGRQFDPEIGYVRRTDFRRSYGDVRISRRTRQSRSVRRVSVDASMDYIQNAARTLVENKEQKALLTVEFNNTDQFKFDYRADYELLPRDFTIARGVVVPQGGYRYSSVNTSYQIGLHGFYAAQIGGSFGSFYGGTRNSISVSSGYLSVSRFLSFEPGMSLNWVDLPYGAFTSQLISNRTIVTPSPRMLISSLSQFNAALHSLATSVRLNWEYRPSSQLFLVYSDGRDTLVPGFPAVMNRSFAVKVTRLVRF